MKNYKIFLYIILVLLFACEKDETLVTLKTDGRPAVITTTADQLNPSINDETLNNSLSINWDKTDYGADTEVSYTVEIDVACNSFSNPIVIGSTTNTSLDLTLDALNTKLLNDLLLAPHVPAQLQMRVTSTIKNQFSKTSDPVTFTITPWSAWAKGLWLISDAWTNKNAPVIYATGTETSFDGYAWLSSDNTFKFANTRTCDKVSYGGSDATLSADASSPALSVGTSGYYRIKADVQNLTYEFTLISSFGVIGTATPGGWGSSTAMTYNADDQTWEVTLDLISGALKFRANDDWGINYGPADANALNGSLKFDDPGAINITDAGNYTVVADFSKKKSPDFTYTITKHAADEAPATLWLPGEYEGWNPAAAPTIKAINSSSFEGYVYISAATGYKFTSAPDWDHINYGDSGTPGTLTTDGLAASLGVSQAGVYLFDVNVNALTYSATLINTMGMIGTSTPGSWDSSSPMTYDQANDVWTATIDLVPGALKFRANDAWTVNYGPADSNALMGTLIFDDPGAINITEAGNYTVTVDFSRDASPYKYAYTVVKN